MIRFRDFSLVDISVAIGVFMILLGLLVPAIVETREAANRKANQPAVSVESPQWQWNGTEQNTPDMIRHFQLRLDRMEQKIDEINKKIPLK